MPHRPRKQPAQDLATFVSVHAVHGAYRALDVLEPGWVFDEGLQREVTAQAVRFLVREPPAVVRLPPPLSESLPSHNPHLEPPPTWKRPRRRKTHERVRAILKAATSLITDAELEDLSMRRVAETSAVGTGTLYRYFPSREPGRGARGAALGPSLRRRPGRVRDARPAARTPRGDGVRVGLVPAARPRGWPPLTAASSWVGMEGAILARARRLEHVVAAALRADREVADVREPARAAFVLVHGLHATVRAMELARPELLLADDYLRELILLETRLLPSGASPARARG